MSRTIKIAVIGARGVGKTSIAKQFLTRFFSGVKEPTVLFDVGHRRLRFHGDTIVDNGEDTFTEEVTFQVWDCASAPVAQNMFRSYLMQCDAVLVVYDCTSATSFTSACLEYVPAVREENSRAVIVLVGNMDDKRADAGQVSRAEAETLAKEQDILFAPCVASRYISVEALFRLVLDHVPRRCQEEAEGWGDATAKQPLTLEQVVHGDAGKSARCCAIV